MMLILQEDMLSYCQGWYLQLHIRLDLQVNTLEIGTLIIFYYILIY